MRMRPGKFVRESDMGENQNSFCTCRQLLQAVILVPRLCSSCFGFFKLSTRRRIVQWQQDEDREQAAEILKDAWDLETNACEA